MVFQENFSTELSAIRVFNVHVYVYCEGRLLFGRSLPFGILYIQWIKEGKFFTCRLWVSWVQ